MSRNNAPRRPSSHVSSDNLQNEVSKLHTQVELEKKARKEAEEKCKQLASKIDVLQQRLLEKNKEGDEQRERNEEIIKSNHTLQMTINKMEVYLRKKNSRFEYINPDLDGGSSQTIDSIIRNENELERVSEELDKERQEKQVLEKRCQLLEQSLRKHNISIDSSELEKIKTEFTNTDLDF